MRKYPTSYLILPGIHKLVFEREGGKIREMGGKEGGKENISFTLSI
jgi:hypothetical protein